MTEKTKTPDSLKEDEMRLYLVLAEFWCRGVPAPTGREVRESLGWEKERAERAADGLAKRGMIDSWKPKSLGFFRADPEGLERFGRRPTMRARLFAHAYRHGPFGVCLNCGGPMTVPYVWQECPRRSLGERLAFWVVQKFGWSEAAP